MANPEHLNADVGVAVTEVTNGQTYYVVVIGDIATSPPRWAFSQELTRKLTAIDLAFPRLNLKRETMITTRTNCASSRVDFHGYLPSRRELAPGGGPKSSGWPLSAMHRRFLESRFKADFFNVRIHVSYLPSLLDAAAFTVGDNIVFRPGAWAPNSVAGLWLLSHELTHVVQQRAGRAISRNTDAIRLLDDPVLEAEADDVADTIVHGGLPQVDCGGPAPEVEVRTPVIQRQKWGWLGQRVLQEGAATVGPVDSFESLDKEHLKLLKNLDNSTRPKDARVIRYHSTATLNEAYATRREAWERTVDLAEEVAKISMFWPTFVYYVGPSAGESTVPPADARLLADGLAAEPPGHSHNRIWVSYKPGNKPDPAEIGLYYEYRQDNRGGALLIVEHTQDAQAIVYTRNCSGGVPEDTINPAKHFHVAFYRREVGSRYMYLPIDANFPGEKYGAYTIAKSEQMKSRSPYDIKFLPSHHIYYLSDG